LNTKDQYHQPLGAEVMPSDYLSKIRNQFIQKKPGAFNSVVIRT